MSRTKRYYYLFPLRLAFLSSEKCLRNHLSGIHLESMTRRCFLLVPPT